MEQNHALLEEVLLDDEPEVIEIFDNNKIIEDDKEEIEIIEATYLTKNVDKDVEVIQHLSKTNLLNNCNFIYKKFF